MWRWRKQGPEGSSDKDVEQQAGWLLCTYAGMKYRRNTARYLAKVVRHNRWHELSPETADRLKALSRTQLDELVADILD